MLGQIWETLRQHFEKPNIRNFHKLTMKYVKDFLKVEFIQDKVKDIKKFIKMKNTFR